MADLKTSDDPGINALAALKAGCEASQSETVTVPRVALESLGLHSMCSEGTADFYLVNRQELLGRLDGMAAGPKPKAKEWSDR